MEQLQALIENYNIPVLSAFILGLMTAISPCPLATNITATAFITKNISSRKKILLSGILYSSGRAFSYTVIGLIIYFGASKFQIARFFNQYGEKVLGPILIVIGLIMLNVIKTGFLNKINFQNSLSEKFKNNGLSGSFMIGIIFALAFCPYSGALYFGILIPMTITSANGLYLPLIFAFGTGLPVILFTYLLAYSAEKINIFYKNTIKTEKVMRYVAGWVFILAGLYYIFIFIEL